MPPLLPGQIGMEKTPGYFHTKGVPERIWRTNNKTKLVLIIRNPVDRMISDYNQFRYYSSYAHCQIFRINLPDPDLDILTEMKPILHWNTFCLQRMATSILAILLCREVSIIIF